MGTNKGIDCAVPLTAEKAKAMAVAGYKFAARYMVPERLAWKRLTKAEAVLITAAGMKVVSVFETTANRPAGGAVAGMEDGAEAFKEAQLIGQPVGSAIYFAVDFDTQAKDYPAIEAYLRAAASKIPGYEIGVYAEYDVIEEMAKRGAAKHFWQTYAWSGGKKSAKANIYQYKNGQTLAGHTVDFNESFGGEGWWDTNPQTTKNPVDNPVDNKPPSDHWAKKDHDELRAAGWLNTDHTADLDKPVEWGEFLSMVNRIRKSGMTPLPSPEPIPEPKPEPPVTPPASIDWAEVEKRAAAASVKIEVGSAGKPGSGTLLDGGLVLTARHVGSGVSPIKIKTRDFGSFNAVLVEEHPDKNVDIALYQINTFEAIPSLTPLPVSKSSVSTEQKLLAVVHGDSYGKVKKGTVDRPSITTSIPPTPWEFDCSVDGNPGDSGGGLVNQSGELVGVIIQETPVSVKVNGVWQRTPGCEAINVTHPLISEWLKKFL